jgi:hypothetical protein
MMIRETRHFGDDTFLQGQLRWTWTGFLLLVMGCSPVSKSGGGEAIQMGVVDEKQLQEVSGIVSSRRYPGVLWMHNDGSSKRLFAVSTNGQVLSTFQVQAQTTDLEDIAMGSAMTGDSEIYLADIGDNDRRRPTVQILRFAEPALSFGPRPKKPVPIRPVGIVTLRYPDQAQDAEALLIDPQTGELVIVAKSAKKARIYSTPAVQATSESFTRTLKFIGELPYGEISAGDISPDGSRILLRREDAAWIWTRHPGETIVTAFSRLPHPAAVIGPPEEQNGESIAFDSNGRSYLTFSEGRRQSIYLFDLR